MAFGLVEVCQLADPPCNESNEVQLCYMKMAKSTALTEIVEKNVMPINLHREMLVEEMLEWKRRKGGSA